MQYPFEAEPAIRHDELVRALLDACGITKPPTSAELIAQYLNLDIKYFRDYADFGLTSTTVRAFLWPDRRLIGVSYKLDAKQRAFSILHEVGHFALHLTDATGLRITDEEGRFIDGLRQLGLNSIVTLEIQANQFAADCLFQLDHFDRYIKETDLTWTNIQIASVLYNASIEATARRWIECTEDDYALIGSLDNSGVGPRCGGMTLETCREPRY